MNIEIEFEEEVASKLNEMSSYTKKNVSELVNKAVKKFISQHKDYFPGGEDFIDEDEG